MTFPNPRVGPGTAGTVSVTPDAVRDTRSLGYTYDVVRQPMFAAGQGNTPGVFAARAGLDFQARGVVQGEASTLSTKGDVVRTEIAPALERLRARVTAAVGPGGAGANAALAAAPSVRLLIDDMQVDPKTTFGVRVFVNAGDAPDTKDAGYVGDQYFFGLDHHAEHMHGPVSVSAVFSLNPTLRSLTAAGRYREGGTLSVTIVPVPINPDDKLVGSVKFGDFHMEAVPPVAE